MALSEAVTLQPTLGQTLARTIALEVPEETVARLEMECERLSRDTNRALAWDRFLQACIAVGLERLAETSALEALELIDRFEG